MHLRLRTVTVPEVARVLVVCRAQVNSHDYVFDSITAPIVVQNTNKFIIPNHHFQVSESFQKSFPVTVKN